MYTAYYVQRDDGDWDLACILAGEDEIDSKISSELRFAIEGRLAAFGEFKKDKSLDSAEFVQVLGDKETEDDFVYIKCPESAWETLAETLLMDMDSSWFDPALREEIQKAFNQLQFK